MLRVIKTATALFLSLVLAYAAIPAWPQEPVPAQETVSVLEEITYQKVENQIEVLIRVSGSFSYEMFELVAPRRLVIDVSPVPRIVAAPIFQVNDVGLLNIRTGQFQPTVARVVFDMADPIPSHSISPVENGVKVVFWQEEIPPVEERPEEKPVEEVKPEVKPEAIPVVAVPPAAEDLGYFVRASGGLTFFLKPTFSAPKDYDLYGETGTITETYSLRIMPPLDLSFGKTITPKFRAGLGVTLQYLSSLPSLEASLPHPLEFDNFRTVTYEESEALPSTMWTVYGFALYSVYRKDKYEIWAGPAVGFSFGTLNSLADLDFTEEAPFESENVTITSVSYRKNNFFKLDPGIIVTGEYSLGSGLAAFANIRIHYVDVMVEDLERRASLFRMNLMLGLRYIF